MLPSPLPLPLGTRWFAARGGTRRQRQPQPPPFPSPSLCPAECLVVSLQGSVSPGLGTLWLWRVGWECTSSWTGAGRSM